MQVPRGQLSFNDHLRGDAGMIGAHLPEGALAVHAREANEGVHERVLKGVAHVQGAGHIRRRNHDRVWLTRILGLEKAARFPPLVQAGFNRFWLKPAIKQAHVKLWAAPVGLRLTRH